MASEEGARSKERGSFGGSAVTSRVARLPRARRACESSRGRGERARRVCVVLGAGPPRCHTLPTQTSDSHIYLYNTHRSSIQTRLKGEGSINSRRSRSGSTFWVVGSVGHVAVVC